jgi:hypothetical protein
MLTRHGLGTWQVSLVAGGEAPAETGLALSESVTSVTPQQALVTVATTKRVLRYRSGDSAWVELASI